MLISWQQAALFNTALVEASTKSGDGWDGTGFFVLWLQEPVPELFLVSNRHVLESVHGVSYHVTLHRKSTENTGIQLESKNQQIWVDPYNPIRIELDLNGNYFEHKNERVDLACIRCTSLLERSDTVLAPLSQNMILDWDSSDLFPSQSVMFVGYPDSIKDRMHNLPIARTGTIASLPHVDFDGQPSFLIDAQVWPGSSGSPVFVKGKGNDVPFSLIGVIHATRRKEDRSDTNIGLGYAVKSSELLSLLRNAASQI